MCGVPVSPRTARGVWECRAPGDDVTSPVRHIRPSCAPGAASVRRRRRRGRRGRRGRRRTLGDDIPMYASFIDVVDDAPSSTVERR